MTSAEAVICGGAEHLSSPGTSGSPIFLETGTVRGACRGWRRPSQYQQCHAHGNWFELGRLSGSAARAPYPPSRFVQNVRIRSSASPAISLPCSAARSPPKRRSKLNVFAAGMLTADPSRVASARSSRLNVCTTKAGAVLLLLVRVQERGARVHEDLGAVWTCRTGQPFAFERLLERGRHRAANVCGARALEIDRRLLRQRRRWFRRRTFPPHRLRTRVTPPDGRVG